MLEQLIQEALALHRAGRLAEAEPLYLKVLALDGDFYPALHLMGLIRLHQNRPDEALPYIERALRLRPGVPEMLGNYSIALDGVGRTPEALEALEKVVQADPRNARAWSNRGALLVRLERHQEALGDFERALALDPGLGDAWNNRGQVLMGLDRFEEALESYDRLLQLKPGDIEARNNRGLALKALGRTSDALAEFEGVIRAQPRHAGAWLNRAAVLRAMGEVDQALASYDQALAIQPDMPEALASRANCRWTRNDDLAGAIADLEKLVSLRPDYPYAQGDLLHLKMHAGDWRDFSAQNALLDEGVRAGKRVAEPYVYQGLSPSPADLLVCAKIATADRYPARPMAARQGRKPGKIRLGYLCGEFRAQATMYLAAGLFEHHDRNRFDVIAFDNSREDQSAMRRRVIAAFDKFLPIQPLPDREVAELIAAEEIDILVNLNGYFGALRMGVFAHRPAPIQVNYLGFPGSLGADYMDYIMADAEVIPESGAQFFSEKLVTLPGCYQINDDRRPLPTPQSRAAHGLKEKVFVFCHFNYPYKVTPEMFAIWLRLLGRVSDSVLWLLESNPLFAGHVRGEAAKAGIDPARIVFAPRMENDAHISRLALGDLFLDSLPYNAHTTASDALWAGLPLLTCRGTAFAGRVAASLLKAVGLPELITENLADYERLALTLAGDRARLQSYRQHLQNRAALALFDTAHTTRHIEAAYQEMMGRRTRGEKPVSFAVRQQDT